MHACANARIRSDAMPCDTMQQRGAVRCLRLQLQSLAGRQDDDRRGAAQHHGWLRQQDRGGLGLLHGQRQGRPRRPGQTGVRSSVSWSQRERYHTGTTGSVPEDFVVVVVVFVVCCSLLLLLLFVVVVAAAVVVVVVVVVVCCLLFVVVCCCCCCCCC